MPATVRLIVLLFLSCYCGTLSAQITLGGTTVDTATVATGLDIPWEIQWGPDDWLWVTERYGRVSRINPEDGTQVTILDLSASIEQVSESGLLGMALHPDFEVHPFVYLVYTYVDGAGVFRERLARFEYNGTNLIDEVVVLDGIAAANIHNGSRLWISADLKMFMTTGDAANTAFSQDLFSLNGKVLRFNLDSSIPQDNPIGGSAVWSWGHRNAQGLLIAPNGRMYISEHGPSTDDEINIIEPGRNYGWPVVKGFCDLASEMFFCNDSNVVEPVTAWTPTIATSDIAWYDHDAIPEFQDRLLLTSLKDQTLYAIALNGDGTQVVDEATYLSGVWGRLRDVVVAPDGSVYLATNGFSFSNTTPFTHRIVRLWNPLATSVAESPEAMQLSLVIAPNPVAGAFEVQFPESLVGGTFEVVDVLGKVIHSGAVKATQMTMDSAEWPRGTYLLNSRHGAAQVAQRLIVQ